MENKQIFEIITKIIEEVEAVAKTHKMDKQNYYFRSTDDILNILNPLFAKHKLILIPKYTLISSDILETKEGKRQFRSVVQGSFTFYAQDGSNLEVQTIGEAMDLSDKSFSKSMLNALKYCLIQSFLIPTEKKINKIPETESPKKIKIDIKEVKQEIKPINKNIENILTGEQLETIYNLIKNNENKKSRIEKFYKVESLEELTQIQAKNVIEALLNSKTA